MALPTCSSKNTQCRQQLAANVHFPPKADISNVPGAGALLQANPNGIGRRGNFLFAKMLALCDVPARFDRRSQIVY